MLVSLAWLVVGVVIGDVVIFGALVVVVRVVTTFAVVVGGVVVAGARRVSWCLGLGCALRMLWLEFVAMLLLL